MRFKNYRKKPFRKTLIGLAILGLILLVFLFFKFFSIKEYFLKFSNEPCEKIETIKREINLKDSNVFFLSSKKLDEEIKDKFICIESAKISKGLPDKINVTLKSREPILTLNYHKLSTPSGILSLKEINVSSQSANLNIPGSRLKFERSYSVDKEGVVIFATLAKKTSFTVDFIGDEPKLLTKPGDFIRVSIEILTGLNKLSYQSTKAILVQDKFLVFYGSPDVIFNLKKDPKNQVTSLQLILQQAKMNSNRNKVISNDSKDIIKIDLRYDKPVITFSK